MATFRKKLVILFGIVLITTSLGYYFGVYLPNKKAGIAEQQKQERVIQETQKQEQSAKDQQNNNQVKPEIDIENTTVFCKSGEKFIGKKLISDGLNFQLIGGNIFYKGEELERLCNPGLKEFDYEAELSFYILPAYKGEIDYISKESENQEILINEPACENEQEIETFKKPVQVVWLAEFGGCLVGCEGASFNRLPIGGDFKYPSFAGYFGEGVFKEKLLKEGLTLKIYGKWTGIDADHPKLVFNNKCVPIVDIEKIEVVK